MWTRHRREAGTCGGRAWQQPREQPVLGGLGAGQAERGKSVRGGKFSLGRRWAGAGPWAKCARKPPPPASPSSELGWLPVAGGWLVNL